jgi:hypothetical protein
MNAKIIALAMALAGASWQGARAEPVSGPVSENVTLAAQAMFRNVRLDWVGPNLIFNATFKHDGHDLTIYLEWGGAVENTTVGRAEIDYIEQYGRDMPIAVTLISVGKNSAEQPVLYMGRPAPNTPKLEGEAAGNLLGSVVVSDDAGRTDRYGFSLSRSVGEALPHIAAR